MKHFGVNVMAGKYGLELTRENYAIISNKNSLYKMESLKDAYADEDGTTYTDEWCEEYQQLVLQNFDLNMHFFSLLDHDELQSELDQFLKDHREFTEVKDLNDYSGVSGYYLMILDKYSQIYIGTSENIKQRIQNHWSKRKSFDRLLLPMYAVNTSVLSIDSFRALDTTRIFAYPTANIYVSEDEYINSFSPQYVCNRIGGGFLSNDFLGYLEAKATLKSKKLI